MGVLTVNGVKVPLTADWSLRFCMEGDRPVAVLYYRGKRVTQSWTLELRVESPADPYGGNANTA